MNADDTGCGPQGVEAEDIRAALSKLSGAPALARNPASLKFLEFVVAETLAGQGDRLKAYTIATRALGRGDDFDPQSDSIVRVQAARLRDMLDDYYASLGIADPVRIVLSPGSYKPRFERQSTPAPALVARSPDPTPTPAEWELAPVGGEGLRLAALRWTLISSAVVILLLFGVLIWLSRQPADNPRPVMAPPEAPPWVEIAPPEILGGAASDRQLESALMERVGRLLNSFEYIRVSSLADKMSAGQHTDYRVIAQFNPVRDDLTSVSFRVLREPSGDVLWSHNYGDVTLGDRASVERVVDAFIYSAGDVGSGAIAADIRRRLANSGWPPTGYRCLITGWEFIRLRIEGLRAAARNCLAAEIRKDPDNLSALTLQASLLTLSFLNAPPEGNGAADLEAAQRLAEHAYRLSGDSPLAQGALFFAEFYSRNFDAAFRLTNQSMLSDAKSGSVLTRVGAAYITRGRYDEGLAMLEPVLRHTETAPKPASSFAALASLMKGDEAGARRYALQSDAASTPLGLLMRMVMCNRMGDANCVAQSSSRLRELFPGFARDLPATLERFAFVGEIKATLMQDVAKAGF